MSLPEPSCKWSSRHDHTFSQSRSIAQERRTLVVVGITAVAMVAEVAAGLVYGSMALLADGLHMASHAVALTIAAFAYLYARRRAFDRRFSFGTGKVNALGGFSGAVLLALFALVMAGESVQRFFAPREIAFDMALLVAAIGLVVNLASAFVLGVDHEEHGEGAEHAHHHHEDHNLRAAYLHVIADALTSLLAIGALAAGMLLGWAFFDPLMGIVGAALIGRWAYGRAIDSARTLLDAEDHGDTARRIRTAMEAVDDLRIADLHLWRVGAASRACILSLVSHDPRPVEYYRGLLADIPGIDHLTIEVHQCRDRRCGFKP